MGNTNDVELIGVYGSDITHALSAWTSTHRGLTDERRARVGQMLDRLMSDGHHTPFEKSALHFLVKCDTATHIHLLKHRISVSINTESARYRELDDKFYLPRDWPELERVALCAHLEKSYKAYHDALDRMQAHYRENGLSRAEARKRAKESARFYLPYAVQVNMDVMFNWRSFMHFQLLRNDKHAQVEVREIAARMYGLIADTGLFDDTLAAFEKVRALKRGHAQFNKLAKKVGFDAALDVLAAAIPGDLRKRDGGKNQSAQLPQPPTTTAGTRCACDEPDGENKALKAENKALKAELGGHSFEF